MTRAALGPLRAGQVTMRTALACAPRMIRRTPRS